MIQVDASFFPVSVGVAIKALSSCHGEKTNLRLLSKIISTDPGVVFYLLRVVNSVKYSMGNHISDIYESIVRLGLEEVKHILTEYSMLHLGKDVHEESSELQMLWKHSSLTGQIAYRLARMRSDIFREHLSDIHIAALFHDIGLFYIAFKEKELFSKLIQYCIKNNVDLNKAEELLFCKTHGEYGFLILDELKMSSIVCDLVKYHEYSSLCKKDAFFINCLKIVHLADILSVKMGEIPLLYRKIDSHPFDIIREFSFTQEEISLIIEESKSYLHSISEMNL